MRQRLAAVAGFTLLVACGSSSGTNRSDGGATTHDSGPGHADARPSKGDGGSKSVDSGGKKLDAGHKSPDAPAERADTGNPILIDAGSVPDAPTLPASLACNPAPIGAVDVSHPTTVVGTGASTCTEAALAAAVTAGGIITFNCGGPTTIKLTAPLSPPTTKDTTLDGGGTVTLDGGKSSRILSFQGPGYRTTSTVVTLQHLTLQNGLGTGAPLPPEPLPCSQGYSTAAGGGAVYMFDGVLHVIDSVFTGNAAATPGPDVGGGAIYSDGSLGTVIVGSRFVGNTASNGGAVGSLNTDLSIYGSTLEGNSATGTLGNNTSPSCTSPSTEVGNGGSGGAVYLDGGSDGDTIFCGDVFSKNTAQALGGAIFRVFDGAQHAFAVSASTFDSNVAAAPGGATDAGAGGGAFYASNASVQVSATTISNNSAPGCGGTQVDTSTVSFVNVTLSGNAATDGVGGAVCSFSGGTFTNCTFAENSAAGGTSYSNYYSAAIFGSTVTVNNTIFDNNTTMNSEGRMTCGATEMGGDDLQWPMNKSVGGSPDSPCVMGITFADAKLGPLMNNGGPTDTMTPAAAASVIQVGTSCPPIDQRGMPRATPCTLGAQEVAP